MFSLPALSNKKTHSSSHAHSAPGGGSARWEWNKLWRKQGWGILFCCLLLLKLLSVVSGGYRSTAVIDLYEQDYCSYFALYGGQLTAEKAEAIEGAYSDIQSAEAARSQLEVDLEQGSISREAYQAAYQSLYETGQQADIFAVFYTAYQYAAENTGQHWLLDSRGWKTLLCTEEWDWLLMLGILLLAVLVPCPEFSTQMDLLLRTTVQGRASLMAQKLTVLIGSAELLCLSFWAIQIAYLSAAVGLPYGNAPLQSLPWFEDTAWALSLGQAAWLVLGLRMFGCCYLSSCLFLGALLLRRKDIVLAGGLGFAVLPIIALSGGVLYHLPLPHALVQGVGYLWPDQYRSVTGAEGVEQVKAFSSVAPGEGAGLLLLSLALMLLIWGVCQRLWTGKRLRKGKRAALALSLALTLLLTGCAETGSGSAVFNSEESQDIFPCGGYTLSLSGDGLRLPEAYGSQLISRALESNELFTGACLYDGDCYYLINDVSDGAVHLYRISSADFSQEMVYTNRSENEEDFFGLITAEGQEGNDSLYYHCFFVTDSYYYLCSGQTLTQIHRQTGIAHVVRKDLASNPVLSYAEGVLYYISMDGTLKIWSEETGQTEETNLFCRSIRFQDGRLTYTDLFGAGQLWE